MGFGDIPIRENGKEFLILASWWNVIRTELMNAFGSGGYVKEQTAQTVAANGEIVIDPLAFKPLAPVSGAGGVQTTSSTPFGTSHGFTGGKEIILLGTSDTNPLTLEVNDIAGGIVSNGKIVLTKYNQVLLIYNQALDRFIRME